MAVLNTTSPSPSTSAPSARPTKDRPSSRTSAAWGGPTSIDLPPPSAAPPTRGGGTGSDIDDGGRVGAVDLLEQHLDPLGPGGGDVLAHVVGANRQLAVAPVD